MTLYLNADFDLSLRPRPPRRSALDRRAAELTVHAIPGAGRGETVVLRCGVPDEFLDHLRAAGVPVPSITRYPGVASDTGFTPWGWNRDAVDLNRRHAHPSPHPPLDVVERVNSRRWSAELEARLDAAEPTIVARSMAEVEESLRREPPGKGWMAKSDHGNAALANRVLRGPGLTPGDRTFLESAFTGDDAVILEPLRERTRDWSVVFPVPFDAARARVHDTVYTRDGALIGARFDPDPVRRPEETASLLAAAEAVAGRLEAEGYFGPVCLDGFAYRAPGGEKIRAVADVNARRSMSAGARRLRDEVAPERCLLYRFFATRRLTLPGSLGDFAAALGHDAWDPVARRGTLLLSPLVVTLDGPRTPAKIAVGFFGTDRAESTALEARFRKAFET